MGRAMAFRETYGPGETPLPDALYGLQTKLNAESIKRHGYKNIDDFPVSDRKKERDKKFVDRKKKEHEGEMSELAAFLEATLPETEDADWWGDVYIHRYHGTAAEYNDLVGTDLILEKDSTGSEPGSILRVDVTKTSDIEKIEEKKTSIGNEIEKGEFTGVYFESEGNDKKVDNKKGKSKGSSIVLQFTEEEIIELGQLINAVSKKEPGSNKRLAESHIQINKIEQGKNQLESQALYALALFFQEVNNEGRLLKLKQKQITELQDLFNQTNNLLGPEGNKQEMIKLIDQFLAGQGFEKLPRYQQTANMLEGIKPWLAHFQKLSQEKKGSLSEVTQRRAQNEAQLNEPHQLLTDRFPQTRRTLPESLNLAA